MKTFANAMVASKVCDIPSGDLWCPCFDEGVVFNLGKVVKIGTIEPKYVFQNQGNQVAPFFST
jgi:hypothetical protein